MNSKALLVVIVLVLVSPFLILELPVLFGSLPRFIRKMICFVPCGAFLFLALQAWHEHSMGPLVISILAASAALYGGFSLKRLV